MRPSLNRKGPFGAVLGIFPVDTFGLMSAEKGNARNGYSEVVQRRQGIWFHRCRGRVTESYISQLLARKKAPPAPGRTDNYEKIGQFLKLPSGELSRLADVQRQQELKKKSRSHQGPSSKSAGT